VLIADLDIKRLGKSTTLLVLFVILIRKLLFAFIALYLAEHPLMTVIAFNYLILFYLSFLAWFQPFNNKEVEAQTFADESILMIVNYHLWYFSEFQNVEGKSLAGNSIIIIISTQITVYGILFFLHPIKKCS
jgi:hypothetical protein